MLRIALDKLSEFFAAFAISHLSSINGFIAALYPGPLLAPSLGVSSSFNFSFFDTDAKVLIIKRLGLIGKRNSNKVLRLLLGVGKGIKSTSIDSQ